MRAAKAFHIRVPILKVYGVERLERNVIAIYNWTDYQVVERANTNPYLKQTSTRIASARPEQLLQDAGSLPRSTWISRWYRSVRNNLRWEELSIKVLPMNEKRSDYNCWVQSLHYQRDSIFIYIVGMESLSCYCTCCSFAFNAPSNFSLEWVEVIKREHEIRDTTPQCPISIFHRFVD